MRPWDLKTVLRSSSAGWMISFLTGTPDRIRTYDTWLRKPVLYPLSYGRIRKLIEISFIILPEN